MNSQPELKRIKLADIVPSASNPRKNFKTPDWPDFVDNIRTHGVIQPGVCRPVKENGGTSKTRVELVCGERRYRASLEAKLPDMPLMVHDLTDAQVVELQQIENLQREDLSALEEAQGYADWRDSLLASKAVKTVEEAVAHICGKINRKRSAVFQKLALLRLHAPVRQALIENKIQSSVAGAIAKVPDQKKQEAILEEIFDQSEYGSEMSFRDVEELIDDEYVKSLKDAPFDKADGNLVRVTWRLTCGKNTMDLPCTKEPRFVNAATIGTPLLHRGTFSNPGLFVTTADGFELAGPLLEKNAKALIEFLKENRIGVITVTRACGGACTDCPNRSGVMDPDSKSPNICTVPECFAQKVKAHWAKQAGELSQKGKQVLTQSELKKRGSHVPGDKYEYTNGRSGSWETLMGKHKPEAVLVSTNEGIKKFYPREEAMAAARKNGVKFYTHNQPQTAAEKAKEEAAAQKRKEIGERREKFVVARVPELIQTLEKLSDAKSWELALQLADEYDGNYEDAFEEASEKLKSPRVKTLGKLLASHWPLNYHDEFDAAECKLWKSAGIDLVTRFEAEEKKFVAENSKGANASIGSIWSAGEAWYQRMPDGSAKQITREEAAKVKAAVKPKPQQATKKGAKK